MPERQKKKMSKSEIGLIFILVLVGALGAFYFKGLALQNKIWAAEEERRTNLDNIHFKSFGKLKLIGKAAVVFDPINKKTLFSLNSDIPFPMASIVKVMTAITAIEELPAETLITISKSALAEEGDTGLMLDEKWRLTDLVQFMLTVSSNDAAKAIAQTQGNDPSSFVEAMNKKAADLGFDNTQFSSVTGLDLDVNLAGASSSASDIAKMISYGFLNHREVFAATSKAETVLISESEIKHNVKNTDNLLSSISNILASKTGFTDLAGGNLAVVFRAPSGRILSAVVLSSTLEGRFSDMQLMIEASLKYVNDIMSRAPMDGAGQDFAKSDGNNS